MPQDWFSLNAPTAPAPTKPSGGDWFATNAPETFSVSQPEPPKPASKSFFDSVGDYVGQSVQSLNPVTIVKGIVNIARTAPTSPFHDPGALAKMSAQSADAYLDQMGKAKEAFDSGDELLGLRRAIPALVPLFGPRMAEANDFFEKGETAKGLGAITDLAVQIAGPAALSKVKGVNLPRGGRASTGAPFTNPNPAEAAAVAFGERSGIPIDAATASGSPLLKRVQKRASDTLGGAGVAEEFRAGQTERLATVGEQMAAKGYPQGVVTKETAGQGLRDATLGKVREFSQAADTEYGTLRALEADPKFTKPMQIGMKETPGPNGVVREPIVADVPLGVDLRTVKTTLTPLYQQLKRESELVPLMGDKGRALTALDRLLSGPDAAPLSVVDGALSDLKSMARSDIPELRSVGQGVAAGAVKKLHAEVDAAAQAAGPRAVEALKAGREATKAKVFAGDLLKSLREEPVQAFNQATMKGDAGVAQLRKLETLVPDEMPKIGRAFLDDLMDAATSEGGFKGADGLMKRWQNLGPETKRLLFKDPAYIKDLDSFFLLAKRIADNPNPSGTASQLNVANLASIPATYPIAKLLYSPTGVKLLTKGLAFEYGKPNGVISVPLGSKAAAAAVNAEIARLVAESPRPSPAYPAAAEGREQRERR